MKEPEGGSPPASPLHGVSDDELTSLVDDVLRSGKHVTVPAAHTSSDAGPSERLHRRVIAEQMRQLASSLSGPSQGAGDGPQRDRWYFEVHGKQLGPLSLQEARTLWTDGVLGPDSYCWHEGFSAWVVLSRVTELAAALAPRPEGTPTLVEPVVPDAPPPNWKPAAGAIAETLTPANPSQPPLPQTPPPQTPPQTPSLQTLQQQPAQPSNTGSPPLVADAPAGLYQILPAVVPPEPRRKRSAAVTQSLLTGVIAGLVIALLLILALRGDLTRGGAPFDTAPPLSVPGATAAAGASGEGATGAAGRPPVPAASAVAVTGPSEAVAPIAGGAAGAAVAGAVTPAAPTVVPPIAERSASSEAPPAAARPSSIASSRGGGRESHAEASAPSTSTASADFSEDVAAPRRTLKGAVARAPAPSQESEDESMVLARRPPSSSRASEAAGASPPAGAAPASNGAAPQGEGGAATGEPPPEFGDDAFERTFGAPAAPDRKPDIYIPPPPGEPDLPATLSQAQVLQVVVARKADVQRCVEAQRAESGEGGRLVMRWRITTGGRVQDVEAVSPDHLTDSALARCLIAQLESWTFPRHREVMDPVTMPFAF